MTFHAFSKDRYFMHRYSIKSKTLRFHILIFNIMRSKSEFIYTIAFFKVSIQMEIRTDFKILFALILITVLSFFYYQKYINKNDSKIKNLDDLLSQLEHNQSHAQFLATIKASKLKSIQLLTSYYGWGDWYHFGGLGQKPFENCTKERRCYAFRLPNNMGQKALEQSDGVLVHIPNLNQLPSRKTYKRRHDQLWMFYTHESPRFSYCLRSYGQISYLDDWFNLTCTIKTDHWYFPYDLDQLHTYQVYFDEFNRQSLLLIL